MASPKVKVSIVLTHQEILEACEAYAEKKLEGRVFSGDTCEVMVLTVKGNDYAAHVSFESGEVSYA